ncbi:MAG: hypothetical protein H7A51_13565 [Akkermansiaceae bacterium]|nr:hypothetical protein [Akkermansiaceae bacterium]
MNNPVILGSFAYACLCGAILVPMLLVFRKRAYWNAVFWCWFLVVAVGVLSVCDLALGGSNLNWGGLPTSTYVRMIGVGAVIAGIFCPMYCGFLVIARNTFTGFRSGYKNAAEQDGASDR